MANSQPIRPRQERVILANSLGKGGLTRYQISDYSKIDCMRKGLNMIYYFSEGLGNKVLNRSSS